MVDSKYNVERLMYIGSSVGPMDYLLGLASKSMLANSLIPVTAVLGLPSRLLYEAGDVG